MGKRLADIIIPPSLREGHGDGFARYLATGEARVLGKRLEMTAVRADGSEFPVELAITRIPSDGPPSFTGYLARHHETQTVGGGIAAQRGISRRGPAPQFDRQLLLACGRRMKSRGRRSSIASTRFRRARP